MSVDSRYPIGRYQVAEYSAAEKEARLADILFLPKLLEFALLNLDESQLQTPYREGGWTVNQVVHHLADSHMNAFIRFKLALTEDNPTIKPYLQDKWVETDDVVNVPLNVSVTLLHSLHLRWHELLKTMSDADWQKTLYHPEQQKNISLWQMLMIYAWHGKHHAAHITNLREEKGW
jgi:hypothetical protein